MTDRRDAGFRSLTPLDEAVGGLRDLVVPHGRSETVPIASADGRHLADSVAAARDVPGEDRAAMDGYAVVASATVGASERAPAAFVPDERAGPGQVVHVHTGGELPDGADAVVPVEQTDDRDGTIEIRTAVSPGENVTTAGENVTAGQHLFDAGRRLAPSDLAVLKAAGHREVAVAEGPRVSVIPTGDELVDADPESGETVETNGLMVTRLVERWGGAATYRDIVPDEFDALATAIERDTNHDLVVTTGGSSVGDRDLLPDVVADRGDLLDHGVAITPGHPLGFGVVDGTPVLVLPGYPVSCLVGAVQFCRPAIAWLARGEAEPLPATTATLTEKIHSDLGTTQFVRVALDDGGASPVRAAGAGVLSSVTEADGWVVVDPDTELLDAGATVRVERWE